MVERMCPACKQPINVNVGLSGDNFKNLFKWPSFQEWIILIMILMMLALAFSYKVETQLCRDTIQDLNDRGLLEDAYGFNLNEMAGNEEISLSELVYDYENPNTGNKEMPEVQE